MRAPVTPRREGGHVYHSEYTWQNSDAAGYRRAFRRMPRGLSLHVLRELAALHLVREARPEIRTRRQLFQATAWEPFKIVLGAGQVRYLDGPLLAWARQQAA